MLTAAGCLMALFAFLASEKTFIDEYWSYSIANSYGDTYTLFDAYQNTWLTPELLRHHLTVQSGERFAYSKVTALIAPSERHPPLYYFLLHSVCSLFPESFSWWYAFSINLILFAASCPLLYLLARRVFTHGTLYARRGKALLALALYVFSMGALNTVIFMRMYMLLTFFTILAMYGALAYLKWHRRRHLALAFAAFFLGGLTQYVFWAQAFVITGFVFLASLLHWRRQMAFCLTALGAFAAACLCWPRSLYYLFAAAADPGTTSLGLGHPLRILQLYLVEFGERFFQIRISSAFICAALVIASVPALAKFPGIRRRSRLRLFQNFSFGTAILAKACFAVPKGTRNRRDCSKTAALRKRCAFPRAHGNRVLEQARFTAANVVKVITSCADKCGKPALLLLGIYAVTVYAVLGSQLWPFSWHSTRYVFALYPLHAIVLSALFIYVFENIVRLDFVRRAAAVSVLTLAFGLLNNGAHPVQIQYNWYIHEDARKSERFAELVKDTWLFYVCPRQEEAFLFNSMDRYYDTVRGVFPLMREDSHNGNLDWQALFLDALTTLPADANITLMRPGEKEPLVEDSVLQTRLAERGMRLAILETDIDIGQNGLFRLYGIIRDI